jgi:CubicO group peptidase (beta-lactamase class C family)
MADVHGHCDPAFNGVKELLGENVKSGEELGACVCVEINGRKVVDIWSGHIDNDATKEWQEDTIVNVFSCSKTVTNLAVLIAHDRGLLDVHQPVAKYWPEFAQNGKEGVLVKHILSHSTGVAGWRPGITLEEVCDVEFSTAKLAKQEPWWTPGTQSGYHAFNQGHLAGELIRRVTGKSLTKFIAEEIAGPLGADFQLGAAEKDWPRISTLIPPPPLTSQTGQDPTDTDSVMMRALTHPTPDALYAFTPTWRAAEIGAANGHGNARALVRILSIISMGGEVDGVKLLSKPTIDLIFEEQTNGMDLVLGKPLRFGIGYGLPHPESIPFLPADGRVCFWGGWVSMSAASTDQKLTKRSRRAAQ